MNVSIHLLSQSQPIEYSNIRNAYTKGGMYCVYKQDDTVDKFPMKNIFRVRESYNKINNG